MKSTYEYVSDHLKATGPMTRRTVSTWLVDMAICDSYESAEKSLDIMIRDGYIKSEIEQYDGRDFEILSV